MEETRYLSYLLRLWPAIVDGNTVWRVSLESIQTGERVGFCELEAFFQFLEQNLESKQVSELIHTEGEDE